MGIEDNTKDAKGSDQVTLEAEVLRSEHHVEHRDNFYIGEDEKDAGVSWNEFIVDIEVKLTDASINRGYSLSRILYFQSSRSFSSDMDPKYESLAALNPGDRIRFSVKNTQIKDHSTFGEMESLNANYSTPSETPRKQLGDEVQCALKALEGTSFSCSSAYVDAENIYDLNVIKNP